MGSARPVLSTYYVDTDIRRTNIRAHLSSSVVDIEQISYEWLPELDSEMLLVGECVLNISLGPRPNDPRISVPDSVAHATPLGEIMFVPSNLPVRFRSRPGPSRTLTCRYDLDALAGLDEEAFPRVRSGQAGIRFDYADAQCRHLLNALVREVNAQGFGFRLAAECLAILALTCVERSPHLDREVPRGALAPWQVRRIEDMVMENLARCPSIADLAAACRVSGRHLMRGYRAATGRTIGQLARAAQMESAKCLLRGSRRTSAEIGRSLGFATASGFCAAFHRETGVTPQEFRTHGA